jgi:hypothetical protein
MKFYNCFCIENSVELVHGLWTANRCWSTMDLQAMATWFIKDGSASDSGGRDLTAGVREVKEGR